MSAAARRLARPFGADDESGFLVRLVVLIAALLLIPWGVSLAEPGGALRLLVPASATAILLAVYLRRPVEALLALALFVLFYDTIAFTVGATIKQVDEIAVGLLFLVALVRAAARWRQWMWLPRDLGVLVALVLGVVSSLVAGVPLAIWVPALILVGKPIAFFYTAMWTPFRRWELRGGMIAVMAIGILVMGLGVVELLNPAAFQESLGLNEYLRRRGPLFVVKSIFDHPALYGWFTAFVGLFFAAQFLITRRWIWLILAIAFVNGPFLSARRRAILALLAGLGAAFVASLRWLRGARELLRAWVPVGAGLVLVVALFSPAIVGLYERTVDRYLPDVVQPDPTPLPGESPTPEEDVDENPRARTALYTGSFEIGRDYFPLGAGLGRYASWMSRTNYSPLYEEYGISHIRGLTPDNPQYVTDTFWPQILGELGAAGLVAYVVFIASLAVMLWREAARAEDATLRLMTLGAGMVFAQAIVESLASAMFHSPPRVYLLYLTVAVVASLAWRREAERVEEAASGAEAHGGR